MRRLYWFSSALLIIASLVFAPSVFAQCESRVLVSPASEGAIAKYAVSIATLDHHCLTGGHYTVSTAPPGAVMFENGIDSFFDIFMEVSTDHYVREIGLAPTLPSGIIFTMITEVTYDDPWYPPVTRVEDCWVNPGTGIFEFFAPVPIPESVPASMSMGQAECLMVVHKVYRIPLSIPGPGLRPCISITPGCLPEDNCLDDPSCTPGGENDYRADVYKAGEQWYLEFEYSNASIQPVCYCVFYYMAWPELWSMVPLLGLDERDQTAVLSASNVGPGNPEACGHVELFSYPPGAEIGTLNSGNSFSVSGMNQVLGWVPVSRGDFLPGEDFYLIGFFDYGPGCWEAPSDWVLERLRVQPDGTLRVLESGGECDLAVVNVPREMELGQAECITVCHDVYYIQLNAPPDRYPSVYVNEGCLPPCASGGCQIGLMVNCCYWVERIGTHWYLRFEYSNPEIEPVCYCVVYDMTAPAPLQSNQLCAFDDEMNSLRVSLWGSSPTNPLEGEVVIIEEPTRASGVPFYWVDSFFDVFMEPRTWDIPIGPADRPAGEAYQLVTRFNFNNPGVPQSVYREWVIANADGSSSAYDPQGTCLDNVPPMLIEGQTACFTACHDIYEVQLVGPPGQPIINIVPGCEPPCAEPAACVPGAPSDYLWWLTQSGSNWILHFEYSNPFMQPVCYCVTYAGTEPVFEPHVLACWDEGSQELDVSVAVSNPSGLPTDASGTINIYTIPPGAAVVLPFPDTFTGVNETWHHIAAKFEIPPIEPESFFDIWCEVQFTSPAIPTQLYREPVHAIASPPEVWVENVDEGGECTGTSVPPYGLYPSMSWCMQVCHDVYHIPIFSSTRPEITIIPGCFGPPQDNCESWECVQGGFWDYRWDLTYDPISMIWMLEFEYSNQNIEPVCYCLTVAAPPCNPVDDLTIINRGGPIDEHAIELNWTAPQAGMYTIYSTTLSNHTTLPPSFEWTEEIVLYGGTDDHMTWSQSVGADVYKNYVVVVDCAVPGR